MNFGILQVLHRFRVHLIERFHDVLQCGELDIAFRQTDQH
jgi:hypothetical protein